MSKEHELGRLFYSLGIGNFYKGDIKKNDWTRIELQNLDREARSACRNPTEGCFQLKCTTHGKETHIVTPEPRWSTRYLIEESASCNTRGNRYVFTEITEEINELKAQFYITTSYYDSGVLVTKNLTIPEIKKLVGPLPIAWRLRRAITRLFWPILSWYHKTFNVMGGELDYRSK